MLARSGALAPLPDEVLDTVEARFRPDEGNAWVGVTGRTRVIVYNPELIDAPAGVSELTAPEFRGKVAIVPENAGFQAFVTGFRASQGDDAARTWLEAMMANDVNAGFKSNGDVLEAVETGQMPVGLINHYYWARDERQPNLTSKLVFPKGDDPGALVNATAVGVTTKGSDNPAARALVEYLISTEGQTYFVEKTFEYPVIAGMAGPKGVPALDELEGPQLDLSDLDSLEQTQAMLRDVGLLS
jgi:iron(III) transport system substrate-binding protein